MELCFLSTDNWIGCLKYTKYVMHWLTLKIESPWHQLFLTPGTEGCHDNLQWHQWGQSWHHDNSQFSVSWINTVQNMSNVYHNYQNLVPITYEFSHIHIILMTEFWTTKTSNLHFDGLVQERHNSSALAMDLRLSCTKQSIWDFYW